MTFYKPNPAPKPHAALARSRHDILFVFTARIAKLGEAGTENNCNRHAFRTEFTDAIQNLARWQDNDRKIDLVVDRSDIRIGLQRPDHVRARVHRINTAFVAFIEQMLDRTAADLAEVRRRTKDWDLTGRQQRLQCILRFTCLRLRLCHGRHVSLLRIRYVS